MTGAQVPLDRDACEREILVAIGFVDDLSPLQALACNAIATALEQVSDADLARLRGDLAGPGGVGGGNAKGSSERAPIRATRVRVARQLADVGRAEPTLVGAEARTGAAAAIKALVAMQPVRKQSRGPRAAWMRGRESAGWMSAADLDHDLIAQELDAAWRLEVLHAAVRAAGLKAWWGDPEVFLCGRQRLACLGIEAALADLSLEDARLLDEALGPRTILGNFWGQLPFVGVRRRLGSLLQQRVAQADLPPHERRVACAALIALASAPRPTYSGNEDDLTQPLQQALAAPDLPEPLCEIGRRLLLGGFGDADVHALHDEIESARTERNRRNSSGSAVGSSGETGTNSLGSKCRPQHHDCEQEARGHSKPADAGDGVTVALSSVAFDESERMLTCVFASGETKNVLFTNSRRGSQPEAILKAFSAVWKAGDSWKRLDRVATRHAGKRRRLRDWLESKLPGLFESLFESGEYGLRVRASVRSTTDGRR